MIRWQKLFEDRDGLFWTLHTGGWLGYALVSYIGSLLHDMRGVWVFVILLNSIVGWLVSIPLRYVFRKVTNLPPWQMLLAIIVTSFAVAVVWQVFKNLHYWEIYKHGYQPEEWYMYVSNSLNAFYIIMCWSGLYFGVKNYQALQREKQNSLTATAMAHQAHLKMLRYQLNPHFLFNTLNAISTLILMQENKTAEKMVSRLSDFLRYSLDKDPIKKVPLKQEIQALNLYLEIEKVRFTDRLHVELNIDDASQEALVPSLILQPIIENAIKYAVSKMENGGSIRIAAHSFGQDLLLEVSDDGPGADIVDGQLHRTHSNNQGVGLTNIQERLQSLYGKNYSFVISHNQPSGIKISIRIPHEVGDNG